MKTLLLILIILLPGCAVQYTAQDGTPVPQRVYDECEYDAQKAAASQQVGFLGATSADPLVVLNLRTQCLKLKGYKPSGM